MGTFLHGADIGVGGVGRSKEGAFPQAAIALTAVITEPALVCAREPIEVDCAAADDELLLVKWLNTRIYEIATRKILFSRFTLRIDGGKLKATAWAKRSIRKAPACG